MRISRKNAASIRRGIMLAKFDIAWSLGEFRERNITHPLPFRDLEPLECAAYNRIVNRALREAVAFVFERARPTIERAKDYLAKTETWATAPASQIVADIRAARDRIRADAGTRTPVLPTEVDIPNPETFPGVPKDSNG